MHWTHSIQVSHLVMFSKKRKIVFYIFHHVAQVCVSYFS